MDRTYLPIYFFQPCSELGFENAWSSFKGAAATLCPGQCACPQERCRTPGWVPCSLCASECVQLRRCMLIWESWHLLARVELLLMIPEPWRPLPSVLDGTSGAAGGQQQSSMDSPTSPCTHSTQQSPQRVPSEWK